MISIYYVYGIPKNKKMKEEFRDEKFMITDHHLSLEDAVKKCKECKEIEPLLNFQVENDKEEIFFTI